MCIRDSNNGAVDPGEADNGNGGNLIFDQSLVAPDPNAGGGDASFVNHFGVSTVLAAQNIISFIRGYEASNEGLPSFDSDLEFRNRTVEVDAELVTYRLGDLVNSRPLTVAGANENYDTEFDDQTYGGFAEVYQNRRQVTYVGSNDGLLHAFNTGFREAGSAEPAYERGVDNNEFFVAPSNSNPTEHALGAELWAYAPANLLPHLQFLTLPNYAHQFYIDGSPQAFDVKIFEGDGDNCSFDPDDPNPNALSNLNSECRYINCLLYTSPSPRDLSTSRMPSSA